MQGVPVLHERIPTACLQVADSGGKVFLAMLAVIDPSLDSEERER